MTGAQLEPVPGRGSTTGIRNAMEVKAIRIEKTGGPSVMKWKTVEVPKPKKGEVTVRHTAVGFNFIDINHRTGRYPLELPTGIGSEAAGVVEASAPA